MLKIISKLLQFILLWMVMNECLAKKPKSFPIKFEFGAATSSYQVEGGWNEDGRSPSIWDHITHTNPKFILDESNGDVACDSYHKIDRDVEMIKELGLDFYRFSLSWSRILPTGFSNKINQKGIDYYNRLINKLIACGIEPMVTIYHFDLPQRLQDLGGWTNPEIVDWFEEYSRVVYDAFGDRVKKWITINEPFIMCQLGYGEGILAPGVRSPGIGNYLCSKNVLLAHAKSYRLYESSYKPHQQGINGIVVSILWNEPATESPEDISAASDYNDFDSGQFIHPIYSDFGDYPDSMRIRIANRSAEQGFPKSRLPTFSEEEINLIKGSSDFLGVNYYTSYLAYRNSSVPEANSPLASYEVPSYVDDVYAANTPFPGAPKASISWLYDVPEGFRRMLKFIKTRYNNPPVYITENGFATHGGLFDDDRIRYLRGHLNVLLDALKDGSDIRGYTAWSLMDNFEWDNGYTEKFGLYEVDFKDPNRERVPRKSALVYKNIVSTRRIDPLYNPKKLIIAKKSSDKCDSDETGVSFSELTL